MARNNTAPRYPDRQGPSSHGGNIQNVNEGGCSAFERAHCIQMRAENEPETLLTDIPGVLQCPACGLKINWNTEGDS